MNDPTNDITLPQWRAQQKQKFKEIKLSKCCRREIEDYCGWLHNLTICMGCWKLNPEIDETLYQCSLCLEEHEDEECNCYG